MNTIAKITCPTCESENVTISMHQTRSTIPVPIYKKLARGILVSSTFGLWWLMVPKTREKTRFKNEKIAICQRCGMAWLLA